MHRKQYNGLLNIWKFILSLVIVARHCTYFYGKNPDFPFAGGSTVVEFFFIVSGYYFYDYIRKGVTFTEVLQYNKHRFLKLFPYTTLMILIDYCFEVRWYSNTAEVLSSLPFEIFYLSNLRIGVSRVGQLWYVAAMMVALLILGYIFVKDRNLFCVMALIVPIIWMGYCNTTYGCLETRGILLDIIRAMSDMFIGVILWHLSDKTREYIEGYKRRWYTAIPATIVVAAVMAATLYLMYDVKYNSYAYLVVFLFGVGLVCIWSGLAFDRGSRITDFLGKMSMMVYIVHMTVVRAVRIMYHGTLKESYILIYVITFFYSLFLLFVGRKITHFIQQRKLAINTERNI